MVVKKYQFTSVNGESVARTFVDLRSYSDLEYKLFDEDSENAEVIEMWPGDEGGPELIVAKKSMLDANAELVTRAVEYLDDSNCLGTNPIITNCTDGQNRALIFNGAIATHMMVKQKIKAITSCDATPDQKTQMLKKLEANLTAKRLDVLEGKARTSGDIDVYVDSVRVFMESQVMCSTKGRRPAHAIAHQIVKSQISRAIDSLGLSCKVETVSQIRWNSTTLYNQLMLIYIGDKFNTPAGFHHVNIYLEKLLPDSCRAEIKLFMKELFSTADYNIAIGLIRTFADRMSEKMVAVTLPTAGAVEDSMAFSVPSDDEVTGAAAAARKPAVGGAGDASSGTSGREAVGRYTSAEASRAAAGGGGYSSGYSGGQSSLRQRAGRSSAAEGEVGNSHAAAHAPQEEMGCCERLMKNTKAFLGLGR